jgi:hypothetical protein
MSYDDWLTTPPPMESAPDDDEDDDRTRIGNTPTCETCGEAECVCGDEEEKP